VLKQAVAYCACYVEQCAALMLSVLRAKVTGNLLYKGRLRIHYLAMARRIHI